MNKVLHLYRHPQQEKNNLPFSDHFKLMYISSFFSKD